MKKVTIEISEESANFLKAFANEIDKQDNRCTAKPYFYVIKTEKWRVAHDEYYSGETKTVWVDQECGDYPEFESEEAAIEDVMKWQQVSKEIAEKYVEKHVTSFTMEKYEEEENAFLTEKGYEDHVRLNGHNLGKRGKGYSSYLKHAFRNPEMASLFKAIGEFKDVKE